MLLFFTIFKYAMGLLPTIVLGIQTIAGDKASGIDKLQMAKDALAVALGGASTVLPQGSANAGFATGAASVVSEIIAATGAINTAVTHTKATGAYQAATNTFNKTVAPIVAEVPASTIPGSVPTA